MKKEIITPGKFVSLTYSLVDEDGTLLEQSDLPVSYIHGGEMELIGGLDKSVAGKSPGEKLVISVPPENAFGLYDRDLVFTDDLNNVPEQFRYIGAEVQMQNEAGDAKSFFVTKIEGNTLTIDGNHPLAGKMLTATVNILEVRDATKEDAMVTAMPGAHTKH